MKLGRLKVANRNLLAPIDMYSDSAFRKLCLDYGCGFTFHELVATAGFIRKPETFKKKVDLKTEVGLQFVSNSPEELKEAIRIVNDNEFYDDLKNVKCIDLNLGCPSMNIMNQGMGSALLNKPQKIRELFKVMVKYSSLPVSAKIRLGLNAKHKKQSKPYQKIVTIAEEEGMDFIAIHGRTTGQGYAGEADMDYELDSKIPIVGNGDIVDMDSYHKYDRFEAVMIGRHALKQPFFFGKLIGKKYDLEKEKMRCVNKYLKYAEEFDTGFQHIKIHMQSFYKGIDKEVVTKLTHCKNLQDIKDLIKVTPNK